MKSSKLFLGILTGLTLGSMAGVLFAPRKGSKTRKGILLAGEDYGETLKDNVDSLVKNVAKKFENTKDTSSKDKEKYKQTKNQAEDLIP